ncbi:MAG: gliding motility lipoprotein GldH [Parabacteroides distasonis]|nr:gliding motility lipoprotein GldH [Parabacteroides distasonis]MBQ4162287.1 gliding motility lipoprotein GldH [Parabacteroides sp.]MBR2497896.1 gliding motility lipoprotein GldH [Parabacteroides sp.]
MLKKIFFIAIHFLFFSCVNPALYHQYQAIEQTKWEKDKEYYFTFEIEDATCLYDIYFEVRNNNLYPYQNLWIFYSEEPPIGSLYKDTTECMLADEFGKWHGEGFSLFHSSFLLRKAHKFPHAGQYTYSIRQGMRDDVLKGIQEIGLRVEPSK